MLERKCIRIIHGPKNNKQTGQYEIKLNAKLKELFAEQDIIETALMKQKMS